MQIIQQIRDKGAAIIIVIIALSLIGFILMDANLGLSRSEAGDRTSLGQVNGKKVTTTEFDAKVKMYENYYGGRVSGAQLNNIRQGAWDELVIEKASETEYEKLGIAFSPKELTSIIFSKEDAPQPLKQAFTDKESGEYDLSKVQQWWSEAKKAKSGEMRDAAETQVIEPARQQALRNKYSGLIAACAYYPKWLKEKEAAEAKAFATISYVAVPYTVIADSTVKVSDEDIVSYMSKSKKRYEQDGGRKIAYVSFSSNPSGADTANTLQAVATLRDQFAADSTVQVFLSTNNSSRTYTDMWVPKSKMNDAQKDTIAALPVNGVFGPYFDRGGFSIAKKIAVRQVPDSAKVRHILVGITDTKTGATKLTDSAAKTRIDSVEAAIRAGADFAALAKQVSDDEGSKSNGGEYTIPFYSANPQQEMSFASVAKEFGEAAFFGNTGDKKVIKTSFGYHYIEVLNQTGFEPAYKIAYMSRDIMPSDETVRKANADANNLVAAAKDVKSFDEYVAKNKLQKSEAPEIIKENDFRVGDLQDGRQLVQWAFKADQGDVSEPINMNDRVVVAVVTKVVPKGLPDAASVRSLLEAQVRLSKKAELIKAKLTASPTLETAAAAYPGGAVLTAGADSTLVFTANMIMGVGEEPKVVGAAFNKAYQAKASEPIEGKGGVYVIKVNSVGNKNIDIPAVDKSKMLAQQMAYGWYEAIKKLAKVEDERSKHF
ncbi:MAG TPA: SurA N-terminal domain-containing protein [Ferruginibacter sp.]|nr:SurA N-terminal domain-containing protein [Ferruginibacter sp.]HPH90236.1 SurA N-terminal domain-containing protein [Ferruginibacter sp.]